MISHACVSCKVAVAKPSFAGRPQIQAQKRVVVTHFKKDDEQENKSKSSKSEKPDKMSPADQKADTAVRNLRRADPEMARQVLDAWKKHGITDASKVRKAFYRAGLSTVAAVALQTAFEAVASTSSFATANSVIVQNFPGSTIVSFLLYSLGWYFAIGVFFDLFTIGATVTSTVLIGTKADAVLASVEELAGERSGLSVLDKAQTAVNTGKIVMALNSIANTLREKGEESGQLSMQTLDRLGALMTLRDAEEQRGFDRTKFGISEGDALRIASQFSTYDTNNDCRLEFSEFKRLCNESNYNLSDEEVKASMSMLDKSKSGFIEFEEFCDWWTKSSQGQSPQLAQ